MPPKRKFRDAAAPGIADQRVGNDTSHRTLRPLKSITHPTLIVHGNKDIDEAGQNPVAEFWMWL
jgi:pimeloyl-ACP methyl ester carboxylesterase